MSTPSEGRPEIINVTPPECWEALRTNDLGRVCFSVDGLPEIFPVNYVVDQGTVVFRTSEHSKIATALDGRPMAFEADGLSDGVAWSVVVKGAAREITGLYDNLAVAELPLHPQQGGNKHRLGRLSPNEITGRRFTVADPQTWETSITSARRSAPE